MSITTKKGDKGKTSLLGLKRVSKDNIRIDACGTLDELCSFLGLCKCAVNSGRTRKIIENIQQDLFIIGSEIVCGRMALRKIKKRIGKEKIKELEKNIIACEKNRKPESRSFSIPGKNITSGFLDVARTIARKFERKAVTLKRKKIINNPNILIYLNRLSDLLFLFARLYEKKPAPMKKPACRQAGG